MDITSKAVIFDGDNGGRIEHLPFTINSMERQGISAIVIEDKIGLKKNSLFKNQTGVKQDSIENFSMKLNHLSACSGFQWLYALRPISSVT